MPLRTLSESAGATRNQRIQFDRGRNQIARKRPTLRPPGASWNRAFAQTLKPGNWKTATHGSAASSLYGSPRRSRVASSVCKMNTTGQKPGAKQKPGLIRISLVRRLRPRRFATPLRGRTAAAPPKPERSKNLPRPRRKGVHSIGQTSNHPRFSLEHFLFDKLGVGKVYPVVWHPGQVVPRGGRSPFPATTFAPCFRPLNTQKSASLRIEHTAPSVSSVCRRRRLSVCSLFFYILYTEAIAKPRNGEVLQ